MLSLLQEALSKGKKVTMRAQLPDAWLPVPDGTRVSLVELALPKVNYLGGEIVRLCDNLIVSKSQKLAYRCSKTLWIPRCP